MEKIEEGEDIECRRETEGRGEIKWRREREKGEER